MRIRILSITHKTPNWITQGYHEYVKRLHSLCKIELIEIPAEKRSANANLQKVVEREGEKILSAVNPNHVLVALDIQGDAWSTEDFASKLESWQTKGRPIDLMIGGPDGLSAACLQKANIKWSLSALTFPHSLVRVIVIEQIYRAFCILKQHPYHR